jgi:hypothetical protein
VPLLCELASREERGKRSDRASAPRCERGLPAFFNQRLCFDDRVLGWEGVEGREKQSAATGLGADETERCHRQTIVRWEIVKEATFAAVGEDFIVNMEENLRCQHFDLEAHFVMDAVSAQHLAALLVSQLVMQEAAIFGQLLFGGSGYFGQVDVGVLPGDDVAGAGDADGQLVILALDFAHGENVKQLRVQGPAVELKDEIAHSRSKKVHTHNKEIVEPARRKSRRSPVTPLIPRASRNESATSGYACPAEPRLFRL